MAERAQHDLKLLTDLGPRITGSYENEVLAVDILQREIGIIQQHANINQKIELDVQVTSGSYFLNFKPNGAINAYGKVQNVVARLASRNNSRHSVLVNAHFDSVPTSPGKYINFLVFFINNFIQIKDALETIESLKTIKSVLYQLK